jgi:Family of unknown function (DUF5677)
MASISTKLSIIRDHYIRRVIVSEILPRVTSIPDTNNAPAIVSKFFLRKATKTLDALCHLCEAGFAEDALVLGRTIYELGVHLRTITAPVTPEQRRHSAECFIYDSERQREKKLIEMKRLKQEGRCLPWINDFEAQCPSPVQPVPMPQNFKRPGKLKDIATGLGGEWECWYHFIYWSLSQLVHPSGLGSHTYLQYFDQEAEASRAIVAAVNMHYFLTANVLCLLDLRELRLQLDECIGKDVLPAIRDWWHSDG